MELDLLILKQKDKAELKKQFQSMVELAFSKIWNNEEDEVWDEYL